MNNYDIIVYTPGIKAYAPLRIQKEAEKIGVNVALIPFSGIHSTFFDNKHMLTFEGNLVPNSKSIFIRGMGEDPIYNPLKEILIDWYRNKGAKVLNNRSFSRWLALDKTTQHLEFVKAGIPVVESHFFGSSEGVKSWALENGFPFIAKEISGSCGKDVFKIDSQEKLDEFLGDYGLQSIKTMQFQKFLTAGEDIRVIVLAGKVLGAMKRIAAADTFLTNYSQGGSVVNFDISDKPEVTEISLKIADHFYLDYGGIDLMKDNDGNWICLEVNRACQFEGFEKATGVNVASQVIEFLTS